MRKRAVDLSLEELAAMGANAALLAVKKAEGAGLAVTGTVDLLENGNVVSSLAQRRPSGAVTILGVSTLGTQERSDISIAGKTDARNSAG